jgi:tRNA (guanine-N7-)-methyltransferase
MIGCEPFLNGVASALRHIDERDLKNVRLHADDARAV